MTHDLKCYPEPFQALWDGRKRFELRNDDRGFQVGDWLRLREWDQGKVDQYFAHYTGRVAKAQVTYIARVADWDNINYPPTSMVVLSLDWPCSVCRGEKGCRCCNPPTPCECVKP